MTAVKETRYLGGLPPRALIVSCFGLYARESGGWLGVAGLIRLLAELGVDAAAARKDAQHPLIARQILDTHALAEALKIDGTPAFIIGDTMVPGADIPALRAAIAAAKAKATPVQTKS